MNYFPLRCSSPNPQSSLPQLLKPRIPLAWPHLGSLCLPSLPRCLPSYPDRAVPRRFSATGIPFCRERCRELPWLPSTLIFPSSTPARSPQSPPLPPGPHLGSCCFLYLDQIHAPLVFPEPGPLPHPGQKASPPGSSHTGPPTVQLPLPDSQLLPRWLPPGSMRSPRIPAWHVVHII